MMTLDEITKKVLEQIDASGFKQSGAFNLRHNGIALCHGDSEHIKIKKKQDKIAADELVRRYYREIYAFTYRQTGERELALDLTQEIFITVLQGIYAFDEKKAGFRTWAYRVAANRITDYYRSKSYKKEKLQQPLQWETEEEKTVRDLAEHMVQKEEIRRIMDIVVSYEREWIRIFQKKCFEEKTFAQIAEEMDLAESTVKTRFYQMLKRIRQEVQR